jgi:hypothetical protein
MNLDDLTPPLTANRMAQLLKKHHNIVIPVDALTETRANKMLAHVQRLLLEHSNSKNAHASEKDKNYVALKLIEQTLSKKLHEAWSVDDYDSPKTPLDLAISIGDKLSGLKRHVPGMDKHDYDAADGPLDVLKKIRGRGVKTQLTDSQINDVAAALGTNTAEIKKSIDDYDSGSLSTSKKQQLAKFFATAAVKKTYSSAQVNQIAKNAGRDSAQILALCQKALNPTSGATVRDYERLLQIFVRAQSDSITESRQRRLLESAMADAEVVLAAKDIADRFQDMVETLGKMVNEELPALSETIRDTMGAEQADAYTTSAMETINTALETIRGSKESLESAARTLAGEEQPTAEPMEPTAEPGADELDQIPPTASGDDQEPLGRGKR